MDNTEFFTYFFATSVIRWFNSYFYQLHFKLIKLKVTSFSLCKCSFDSFHFEKDLSIDATINVAAKSAI